MSKISLILAVDLNGGMGFKNALSWHLPADFAHFKQHTLGKPIVMGRKTYESIGRALPHRRNIVLSRRDVLIAGVEVVQDLEAAFRLVLDAPEVMVIGGADVFQAAMEKASCIYLTRVHHVFEADVFFPELDQTVWQENLLSTRKADIANAYDLSFYCYTRRTDLYFSSFKT